MSGSWKSMFEQVLERPDATMEFSFCADDCPVDWQTPASHRHAQVCLSIGAGGLDLTLESDRRFAAAIESVC